VTTAVFAKFAGRRSLFPLSEPVDASGAQSDKGNLVPRNQREPQNEIRQRGVAACSGRSLTAIVVTPLVRAGKITRPGH
jgi:hypothetical protein